jgi:hypothetical protein
MVSYLAWGNLPVRLFASMVETCKRSFKAPESDYGVIDFSRIRSDGDMRYRNIPADL